MRFIGDYCISTHTPAWGATLSFFVSSSVIFLFQLTRPRGARRLFFKFFESFFYFNSHARVGRDQQTRAEALEYENFNSHARVGRDKKNENANKQRGISTHTPAWGATT